MGVSPLIFFHPFSPMFTLSIDLSFFLLLNPRNSWCTSYEWTRTRVREESRPRQMIRTICTLLPLLLTNKQSLDKSKFKRSMIAADFCRVLRRNSSNAVIVVVLCRVDDSSNNNDRKAILQPAPGSGHRRRCRYVGIGWLKRKLALSSGQPKRADETKCGDGRRR